MKVLSFCFCKDDAGHFGLVKSYAAGFLTVLFDDGAREVRPSEVTFVQENAVLTLLVLWFAAGLCVPLIFLD